jgi:orotidine-5'-phosphate decarboxylase
MLNEGASSHAADRLLDAIASKRSPVCVGLDPVLEKMPKAIARVLDESQHYTQANVAPACVLERFCIGVIGAIAPFVPCVKIQSACFERYGSAGSSALRVIVAECRKQNLQVILDAKRGDIGVTAEHYASAAFDPIDDTLRGACADWLTINSYLGDDAMTPFLRPGHGAFALVRTSNPGGDVIQSLRLDDGRTVAQAVGEIVARVGSSHVGMRGYSSLGAVVGATKCDDAAALRKIMPQQVFLVPGYGAQGGGVDDVLPCFNPDGTGAIVTASRSVIYAFRADDPSWTESVGHAAAKFADEIGRAVGMR